jgi:hypothetical protein
MSIGNMSTTTIETSSFSPLRLNTEPTSSPVDGFDFGLGEQASGIEEERRRRKEALAAAFRIFAKHNLGVGVVGHLTVRDPGRTDCFWCRSEG